MLWAVVKTPLSNSLLDGRFLTQRDRDYTPMQKLSLLVAASVIGLGSAYSAMAQAPVGKPGAKATIQAPAVVAAKGNLASFARVMPGAEAHSAKVSVGALVRGASAQAVVSTTGGKLSALAAPRGAASNAKSGVGALANAASATAATGKSNIGAAATSRGSSAAAAKSSLNPTANAAAVVRTKSNFGSMARLTSDSNSKAGAVTARKNIASLARAVPAAAMVNKSNFGGYVKSAVGGKG
jgi:hypothetical protein